MDTIDGLIPVYCGNLHAPLDYRNLNYIVWKTNLRASAAAAAAASHLAGDLSGPRLVEAGNVNDLGRKPEHVALFMEFGTSSRSCTLIRLHHEQPRSYTSYDIQKNPERFCFHIRGHGRETYHVLRRFPGAGTYL